MARVTEVCEAITALLRTADDISRFFEPLEASRAYMSPDDLKDINDDVIHCLVVPSHSVRKRTSNGTFRRDVVVEIMVRRKLGTKTEYDQDLADEAVALIEQIDDYLAYPDNCDLTMPDDEIATYIDPADNDVAPQVKEGLGAYWNWDDISTLRMVTGLVRVAYSVDESYSATA